jgi:thiamine biosynthesis lipoprotein
MSDSTQAIILSLEAMATRFELVLYGDDPIRLRAAGEQALHEIERLEGQLSFYRADSEVAWINSRAAEGPVRIDPRLFHLLMRCADLSKKTDGAFDVTVGPLMRAWGFADGSPRVPDRSALAAVRNVVGMQNVELYEEDFTVRFKQRGVEIDLGGYGKGYAVERAASILRENGITSALLHGGTSSVFAVGAPPLEAGWKIALSAPFGGGENQTTIELKDSGLSVSAAHGKSFNVDGCMYGHVLDPRTGEPARGALAAAVTGPSPSVCEALSTALLVLGESWGPELKSRFPDYQTHIAQEHASSIGR